MSELDWLPGALAMDEMVITAAAMGDTTSVFAPFVQHQMQAGIDPVRLPEHFRGAWAEAQVCFLGPHVSLIPEEGAPATGAGPEAYAAYYQAPPPNRLPYSHYGAVMEGAAYVATELVHWPAPKELAMNVLASPAGPSAVSQALSLTWELLRESPVNVLVLTGNDAIRWVLPALGGSVRGLPGVTRIHGQQLGRFPLPGSPGRELTVVASFHWSAEMPLFVRKVPGLQGLTVPEAIRGARAMLAQAIRTALQAVP